MTNVRPALVLLGLFTLLTGLAYPLAVTWLGQALFPTKANGSMEVAGGRIIGSRLIGQDFTWADHLWPRPSATARPYDASASSGSNLGPTSRALEKRIQNDVARLRSTGIEGKLPADAATTSGSGLDPDISPAFALEQAPRIARARGAKEEIVTALIRNHIQDRELGVFGEPRVNVLAVNRALDAMAP